MEKENTNLLSWDYILQMQDDEGNVFISREVKENITQLLENKNE